VCVCVRERESVCVWKNESEKGGEEEEEEGPLCAVGLTL
jgi:hypothetical protein